MDIKSAFRRFSGPALLVLAVLAALYLVTLVYASGELVLAITLLVLVALSVWIYGFRFMYAYRYLFPAIAAALIFVVFPIVYTGIIASSNYNSRNLLDFQRATKYLCEDTYRAEGATYAFTLHPDGSRFRARLEDPDSGVDFLTPPFDLAGTHPLELKAGPTKEAKFTPGDPESVASIIDKQEQLKRVTVKMPDGSCVRMTGLDEFAPSQLLYRRNADGSLTNNQTGVTIRPNFKTGFYESADGEQVTPGFHVKVGWDNYVHVFTDKGFREPFLKIFVWTVVFAALSVFLTAALGMVLAVLLNWDSLRGRSIYRLLLFLPYCVPGFISILVFKGLFNNNTGEINLILHSLLGLKPAWFSEPFLTRAMLLIVNTWLGFPYMMVVCMGLIKAIPNDLYEASAVAGAGPLTNFFRITVPLIRRPLMPLLIASFAFNFNNLVLILLLTGGRPDFLNTSVPAGTTDLLVTYTYRIAFQDSGQQFGLAAAIAMVIFLMVVLISLVQIRFTKIAQDDRR